MGRKNRRAEQAAGLRPLGAVTGSQSHPDGDWHVRQIAGAAATKTYRCPGCDQEIRPGVAHVVAWRADRHDGEEFRRHWHTPCWNARGRRRPR
ncbi:MAG TPA: hypothetical protein VF143_10765 [Candidatus Nanopelagicales bacterium]